MIEHNNPKFMIIKPCTMKDSAGNERIFSAGDLISVNKTAADDCILGDAGEVISVKDSKLLESLLANIVPVSFKSVMLHDEVQDESDLINIVELNPSQRFLIEYMRQIPKPMQFSTLESIDYH